MIIKRRTEAEKADPKFRITRARANLLLTQPFFATLAMGLKLQVREDLPTMATDGEHIFFNPDWVATLSDENLKGVIAHEVCHVAHLHHTRRMGREPERWNIACDVAINHILEDAGFALPPGQHTQYPHLKNLSSEAVYNKLPPGTGKGQGQDPNGWGGILDAPGPNGTKASPSDMAQAEQQAKVSTINAAHIAKARGKLPGSLQGLVKDYTNPRLDPKQVLRDFLDRQSKGDYSWDRPNRRFIQQGIYLPRLNCRTMGELAIIVDTSGSVDDSMLRDIGGFLVATFEQCKPERVTVLYTDAIVQRVDTYEQGELFTMSAPGRGGTDLRTGFRKIEELGLDPTGILVMTDCETPFPDYPPDAPVIWLNTGDENTQVPFGEIANLR